MVASAPTYQNAAHSQNLSPAKLLSSSALKETQSLSIASLLHAMNSWEQEERILVQQLRYWKTECMKKWTPHLRRSVSRQTGGYWLAENKHNWFQPQRFPHLVLDFYPLPSVPLKTDFAERHMHARNRFLTFNPKRLESLSRPGRIVRERLPLFGGGFLTFVTCLCYRSRAASGFQ